MDCESRVKGRKMEDREYAKPRSSCRIKTVGRHSPASNDPIRDVRKYARVAVFRRRRLSAMDRDGQIIEQS